MQILYWVLMGAMILLNLFTVYLGVTFLFTFKKRKSYPAAAPKNRFAVIIAARNEEKVVGNLIAALKGQDYPADKIDIFVAVNNTTDNTAAVSIAAGAQVIQCQGRITCKGQVLHQAIDQLLPGPYDAYAVFDADNIPAPDFLRRMNDALEAGERVCKGRLKCGNFTESWVSGGYGLYHALMEWSYSWPHTAAGFSSNLVGTAFVVHREVLEALGGWNTVSICEDTEFAAQATRLGHRVAFVYDAMSYDEQVSSLWISLKQRHRWCYGMIQCARLMTRSMFSPSCPRRGMARDFGMLFIISHTAPIAGILGTILMFFQPPIMLMAMTACLVLAYAAMVILALWLCRFGQYPARRMLPAILLFPIFMATWAPLQIFALFVPVKTWAEIKHNGQDEV